MSENSLNDKILSTYNNNIEFLKNHHSEVYEKIELLESAMQAQLYTEKYDLEYKENYFDVFQHINGSFLYNQDSNKYSKDIINKMTFDEVSDNFKPYRHFKFDDTSAKELEKEDLLSNIWVAISPFTHYIDTNAQQAQNNSNIHKFIFFGMGLGLHLKDVDDKFNSKIYFICEPDLELFRLSLFTTSYSSLAKKSKLIFSIADTNEEFESKCDVFLEDRYVLNYNIKFNLFSQQAAYLIKLFQARIVIQTFLVYSYPRCLMSSTRPFEYIKENYKFLDVTVKRSRTSILTNFPTLVLGSGPSLQRNSKWLIDSHLKFIVITVSANLRFLYENNIKPDVIIHIDEDKDDNLKHLLGVDMEFFKDSLVILSSITDSEITKKYIKNSKYIIQAQSEYYKDLGRLFAISVGEVAYAFGAFYGAKEIYLLGLDYALDPLTNQTHYGNHINAEEHNNISEDYQNESLDIGKNYISIKGNLREKVYTTSRFQLSISNFNYFTQVLKYHNLTIYNLNDGAYLENSHALKIENLNISDFIDFDKSEARIQLNQDLWNNSKNELTLYDKKIIKRKLKNAKFIKELIRTQFSKKNYKDSTKFLTDFEQLIYKISKGENKTDSEELNRILFEYTRLVSHYIYNFCEQSMGDINIGLHINNLNSIFIIHLLKIVDEYIIKIQSIITKV